MYFCSAIPHSRQHVVKFELAKFFTELCTVQPSDTNILNQLLNAPLEDLQGVLSAHNRFLPDGERGMGSGVVVDLTREDQTPEDLYISPTPSDHGVSQENGELNGMFASTGMNTQPLTAQPSTLANLEDNLPEQIRRFMPSFDAVSRSITRKSRRWRVEKHTAGQSISQPRGRSGSLHIAPGRSTRRSPSQRLSPPVEIDEIYSAPIASMPNISEQISKRAVGSHGELFVRRPYRIVAGFMLTVNDTD